MLKNRNILLLLIALLTLPYVNNDLFAHEINKIDDLLLELENKISIQDPVFTFNPKRWGIIEGVVSDEVALKNKKIINSVMARLPGLGINIMEIGAMDAYFKVDVNKIGRLENHEGSIKIPSDFHLKMSDDTFLRVQPNSAATYSLMTTYLTDNSKISGGNLIGDRFEHDYSPFTDAAGVKRNEHGWGHLLWIIGSHRVTVENVNFSKAIGDGIVFHSETLRNDDGSLKPNTREVNNVSVRNVNIDECRRNGISILDGRNITFDNCNVTNTGNGSQAYNDSGAKIYSSAGTAPRYGIDMEAIRTRNADGTLNETALIQNINVKNSNFTGNEAGDIVVYTANQVIIENNYFDKWVANKASHNVIINNNNFESRDPSFFAIGINSFIDPFGNELNHDYLIKGNKIKNYSVGIRVAGENQEISNNDIIDCATGIFFISNLINSNFNNNNITSSLSVSYGYKNFRNCDNINNIIVNNDIINVMNRPISFIKILNLSNLDESQLTFKNCDFNTSNTNFKLHINEGKNILFEDNTSNTDFQIINSENIILNNNIVN